MKFPPAQIKHRDRRDHERAEAEVTATNSDRPRFDFSYSGIKTAVLRYVEIHEMRVRSRRGAKLWRQIPKPKLEDYLANCDKRHTLDLVASFQRAMVEDLVGKTLAAARAYDVATLFVTGGVAANNELRKTFERNVPRREAFRCTFPSRPLSTDNAAMIAAAAYPKFWRRNLPPWISRRRRVWHCVRAWVSRLAESLSGSVRWASFGWWSLAGAPGRLSWRSFAPLKNGCAQDDTIQNGCAQDDRLMRS